MVRSQRSTSLGQSAIRGEHEDETEEQQAGVDHSRTRFAITGGCAARGEADIAARYLTRYNPEHAWTSTTRRSG